MKDGLLVEYMANQPGSGSDAPEVAQAAASPPHSTSAMLPQQRPRDAEAGQRGQMSAVWRHKLSAAEKEVLRRAPFPRLCIHGRQDIVAAPSRGAKVAEEIAATLVVLEGAHFIPRERGHEVRLLPPTALCMCGRPSWAPAHHHTHPTCSGMILLRGDAGCSMRSGVVGPGSHGCASAVGCALVGCRVQSTRAPAWAPAGGCTFRS